MKNNFKIIVLALLLLCAVFSGAFAQPLNQHADPSATAVIWSTPALPLGTTGTVTFVLGNSGTDPIPAEKVEWTINIPLSLVTAGSPGFVAADGTKNTGLYEYLRVVSGTTLVIVLRSNTDISATSAQAPQDQYKAVYPVTGAVTGGPAYATLNAGIVSGKLSQVGNASASNDNATAAILVSAAPAFELYPNPASNIVNINITSAPAKGKANAILYDVAGRVMVTQILQQGTNQVDVSRLTAGLYTVVIEGLGQTYKIVIAR